METFNNLEVIFCVDESAWEAWLADNYTRHEGVWVKIARKSSGIPSVTHLEALDGALCFGWIDGQGKPYEDKIFYLQKFTPRRPKSTWSNVNTLKVERLIAAGRMREPGFAAIAAAKADGRWERAYASQKDMVMPDDFASALANNPKAAAFFETLNKANRYAFLWRVATTKTPKQRKARIEKFIVMLETSKKFH